MTPSTALAAALVADTDHVACFNRDGTERRWPELVTAASRVHDLSTNPVSWGDIG